MPIAYAAVKSTAYARYNQRPAAVYTYFSAHIHHLH